MPSDAPTPTKNAKTRSAAGLWRRRILGTMRVMAYVFVASLAIAAIAARVVYADLREATLDAGRELAQLNDVLGSTKGVFINGERMNVSTAFTDQSPKQVLDRFEAVCADHPDFVARAMSDIPKTLEDAAAKAVPDKRLRLGIIRNDVDGEGALTCFTDDRPSSLRTLPERVRAFAQSKDLTEFGRFRYVYVNRTPLGNTHVTTVWTEGSFNLGKMFPAQGDGEGFDSTIVPRPPHAKRILAATAVDVPFGVHVYDSRDRKEEVRSFYDAEMKTLGWYPAGDGKEVNNTVVYVKNSGMMLYVTAVQKDLHTLITAVETARKDTPTDATVHIVE